MRSLIVHGALLLAAVFALADAVLSGSAGSGVVTAGAEQEMLAGPEMVVMLRAQGATVDDESFMARDDLDSLLAGRTLTVHLVDRSFSFEFRDHGRVFAAPFGREIPSARLDPMRLASLWNDVAATRVLVFENPVTDVSTCQCEGQGPVWTIDLMFNSMSSGSVTARFTDPLWEEERTFPNGTFRVD